ncbi:hybrid sensor histidine kinase/response regulator [Scytonema hofmannii PCC 7110]|uniref:histidine kinase n=1 Tax=Scytonema hofmannii PCC 7110 TaxID=128403 RepID=A0A139X786_9CYAN|nr:PAS domain S-box protein [Scytonema hofmannii]KYC40569.1 hybrid sensor histidine kinase/response regulator [Scytonema hofmannii PCC 7110]
MRDEDKTKEQLIQEIAELRQRVCSLETLTAQQQQAEKALYEHTQRQVQREQALNRVIQSIRNSLDIKTIFSTAAREVAQLVQADRAEIVQYLSERQLWLNVTDYRKNLELPSALGLEIPDVNNEVASRLKRLEVVLIEDASTYPDEINRDFAETYSGAWLLVPLQVGSSVWGSLSVIRTHQSSPWQQEDVELTCAVADQLAIAIQQSTLYEQVQSELLERKRAEAEIYFQAHLLSAVEQAVIATDLDGKIIYWNRFAETLYGWLAQEVLGQNIMDVVSTTTSRDQAIEIMSNLQQGKSWSGEFLVRRRDGTPFLALVTDSPIYNDQGVIIGVVGISVDITERKQTEEKIRQQAALLDIATDAILVRDLNHKILFWNKSAERLYGWKTQEALGQNAQNLLYREIPPQLQEALHQVNKTGEWYGELNKVRKDGKEIIVESRWTLVQDENGKPKSILNVDTDITEKKQLQTQFLRAQRLESLGTLASGIAHDLNNILSPILLSAQILQIKIGNEQHNKLLETLEINTQRGANLVKQVLSFARGVEGQRTVLQIKHLIMEIQQLAKQTFPKSIEFVCKIAPNLWTVCGDATQLYQMLMNLVINSRDAMPKGGILELSAENFFIDENYARMNIEATVGHHIVISVRDTGIGMSPEVLDRIFEPFFTTKAVGQGTGLGLSTVLGIVKSHSGFINVSSSVGKGTEFQVFLKAVMENETQSIENSEIPTGNGELILVVDDEAKIREITKTTLENYNYKVLIASDGIAAISLYAQNVSDIRVVLLDMMMPTMDGFTTIQTLKKINPFVKIIASSGLRENQLLAESVGIHKFLPKPYTVKQLLLMLQSLI